MIVYPKFRDGSIVISTTGIKGTIRRICNFEFTPVCENIKTVKLLGWNPYLILEDDSSVNSNKNCKFTYVIVNGNGDTHRFEESQLKFCEETEYELAINYSINYCYSELLEAVATRKYCVKTLVFELLELLMPALTYRDWLRDWVPKDLDPNAGWKGHFEYGRMKMSQYESSNLRNDNLFNYQVFVTKESVTFNYFRLDASLLPVNQNYYGYSRRGDRPLRRCFRDRFVNFNNKPIVVKDKIFTKEHYEVINEIYKKAKRTYSKLLIAAFRKYDKTTRSGKNI